MLAAPSTSAHLIWTDRAVRMGRYQATTRCRAKLRDLDLPPSPQRTASALLLPYHVPLQRHDMPCHGSRGELRSMSKLRRSSYTNTLDRLEADKRTDTRDPSRCRLALRHPAIAVLRREASHFTHSGHIPYAVIPTQGHLSCPSAGSKVFLPPISGPCESRLQAREDGTKKLTTSALLQP
ncbi:hypothetical protein ANO11243_095050 [Dothideomycetidae sp. 11243]|nr:hypothetical protein ANO11243_095050 [fungal sp. No.11243]